MSDSSAARPYYDQSQFPENSDWDQIRPEQDRPRPGLAHYDYQGAQSRPPNEWGEPNEANKFAESYGPAMPEGPYWPTMQQVPHVMRSTMGNMGTFSLPMQRGSIGAMRGTLAYLKAYDKAQKETQKETRDEQRKEANEAPLRHLRELDLQLHELGAETDRKSREYRDIIAGTDAGSPKQRDQLREAARKNQDHYVGALIDEGRMDKALAVLAEHDKNSQEWQGIQKSVDAHLKSEEDRAKAQADRDLAIERTRKLREQKEGGGGVPGTPVPAYPKGEAPELPKPGQTAAPGAAAPGAAPAPSGGAAEPEAAPKSAPPAEAMPSVPPKFHSGPKPPTSAGEQPPPIPKRPTPPAAAPAAPTEQQGAAEEPEQEQQQPIRTAMAADPSVASDAPLPGAQRVAGQQVAQAAPGAAPGTKAPVQAATSPQPISIDEFAEQLARESGVPGLTATEIKRSAQTIASGQPGAHISFGTAGTAQQRSESYLMNRQARKFLDYQNAGVEEINRQLIEAGKKNPNMTPDQKRWLQDWGIDQITQINPELGSTLRPILDGNRPLRSANYTSSSPYNQILSNSIYALDFDKGTDKAFTENRFNQKAQAIKNFGPGGLWGTRLAANATAIQHSAKLWDALMALDPSEIRAANGIENFLRNNTGDPRVIAFNTARLAFAEEMARSFRGNNSSLTEVQENLKLMSSNVSKEQGMAYMRTMAGLLMGAVNTGTNMYNFSTFQDMTPEQMLAKYGGKEAVQWMRILQGQGGNDPKLKAAFDKGLSSYRSSDSLRDPTAEANESDASQIFQWYIANQFKEGVDKERLQRTKAYLTKQGFIY
jgi:hypothetical protein